MKFLYSWIKDYISLKESPEKLAEFLNLYVFETNVMQKLRGDAVLDVELFPNRVSDAASHVGLARELAIILRRRLDWKPAKIWKSKKKTSSFVSVKVTARDLCPRYSVRVVTGVKVGQSPLWLRKRLAACGLRPINNVVDVTNYVMLEIGEPLHAFDFEKIKNGNLKSKILNPKSIFVRRAKQGEVIDALDEKTYRLEPDDLVIADAKGPLAIAGIKGGRRAEIDKNTKTVVLEAANFDPIAIRKTSKRMGLRTDSSWRFENGMDPNLTTLALDRAAELIQVVCGGEIAKGIVDVYPKKVLSRPIAVDMGRLQSLIGEKISAREAISLLKPITVQAKSAPKNRLLLKVHTVRRDLQYPEDIAEEVARLRGHERLKATAPVAPLTPPTRNESWEFRDILRNHLAGLGFSEVYNYSFMSEKDAGMLELDRRDIVEIENPTSKETKYLRRYLLVNHLKNVRDNMRFFPEVKIFEEGAQYRWHGDHVDELWRVAGVLARKNTPAGQLFFEVKGVIESLFEQLGFDRDDYQGREVEDQHFLPGTAVEFAIDGQDVARVGIFRPQFTLAYEIDAPVVFWAIGVEDLRRQVQEGHEFEPPHKYPDVIRDISMIVSADRRVEEVQNVINSASPKYLEDLDLFDIYESPELGENKQSLAFHLIFRAPDRTLTDAEVNEEMKKIIQALEQFGAEIR